MTPSSLASKRYSLSRWVLCVPAALVAAVACKWVRDLLVAQFVERYPTKLGQILASAEEVFGWLLCGIVFSAVLWHVAPAFKRRAGWIAVALALAVSSACGAIILEHKVSGWELLFAESAAQLAGMAGTVLYLSGQRHALVRSAYKSAQNPSNN